MTTTIIFAFTEHIFYLTALLFPPVFCIVGLWGADELQTSQVETRGTSFDLGVTEGDEDDLEYFENLDAGHYCSLDLSSTQSPTDSGLILDSPMARSLNSLPSLRKSSTHNGSSTSILFSIIVKISFLFPVFAPRRVHAGIEAIIEDEVTSRFRAEQLASWNMLTRTSVNFYQFVNWKLAILWGLGFLFRYFFLLPMRLIIFSVGLITVIFGTAFIGLFPGGRLKRWMNEKLMKVCMRIGSRAFSAIIYFHDTENKATSGGICVANHTSPIDVMILATDAAYALIGQSHDGFLGAIQRALSRASSHIWFERSEAKDRSLVAKRLHDHVNDPSKLPVLIFPEGTCINNTSVMMFKKGSFEVDTNIYPIAMKYDSRFGDAFWNSSEQSYFEYLMQMMSSWALICNVWYLPAMRRNPDESAIEFANRVKKAIAIRGGLVDLEWDGQLKRYKVPAKLLDMQRERYYQRYQRYTSLSEPFQPDEEEGLIRSSSVDVMDDEVNEAFSKPWDHDAVFRAQKMCEDKDNRSENIVH
uniref:PlsC domain-containing protein n=1 Tax=Meloidogyne hapla TaxID=6305 RepID=A0A1I8C1P4_MELHA